MKYSFIISLLFIGLLISCSETNKQDENKRRINVESTQEYDFQDLFEITDMIPLETKDSALIQGIDKLIYYNEDIFLLDRRQKAVFRFDLDGNMVSKLQKTGRGPGEYLDIADFAINPFTNNFELLDARLLRIYDLSGNFIGEEDFANEKINLAHRLELIDESTIAFISFFAPEEALIYSRETHEFTKKQTLYPLWIRKNSPFGTSVIFHRNNNEIYYTEAFSNKVYSVDKDGFKLAYEWDFGDLNFDYKSPVLSNKLKKDKLTREEAEYYIDKYVVQFQSNIQNDSYLVTNFFYKKNMTTLIYNKKNNNYLLANGDVGKILMNGKICFLDTNQILVIEDAVYLKSWPKDWLPKEYQKKLDKIDISDNPIMITLKLKDGMI